jgi:hypothetical protein
MGASRTGIVPPLSPFVLLSVLFLGETLGPWQLLRFPGHGGHPAGHLEEQAA